MQNYDKVLEYTNKTMNASGTSAQKYTHYMSSLEAKINELTVQWEQFIQELDANGVFKNAIKFVSGLLSVLDALVNKAPILQSLLGAFVLSKGIKGVLSTVLKMASVISKFKGLGNSIKALANSFKSLAITNKTLKNVYTDMNVKLTAYQRQQVLQIATNRELNTEAKKQALTNMGLSATETELVLSNTNLLGTLSMLKQKYVSLDIAKIQQILTNDNLADSEKRVQIAFLLKKQAAQNGIRVTNAAALSGARLIVQQNGLKMSAQGATAAMTALNIAIGVVTFAISAGISAIMSWQQEQQQLRDNAIDTTDAYNEQASSMEELMEKYKELKAKLDKTQDLDAQKEITSEILDIRNQVIDSYGEEATKIDFINGQLNETLGLWQQINQEQAQETYVKNKVEYQKALDYAESSGYWNALDFANGKFHGRATDVGGVSNLTDSALRKIGLESVVSSKTLGLSGGKYYRFHEDNVFETYDKLVDTANEIQKALEHNTDLTDDEINALQEFQKNIIAEINAYDKDENFTKNKQLYESAQQSVIDAMDVFQTDTGELVSPSALYDLYTGAIEDLNTLSADFDFGNQEMVDNWHKIVDEDIPKYQDYLQQLYNQTTDETQKGYLKKIIDNLEKATDDATRKVSAGEYISGQISGQTDLIKKINDLTAEELAASQDEDIVKMFKDLQAGLEDDGIVMSIEEIAQAISGLGYTYKETEKITAAGLIENFSTDESEIKTITENIEKLNNAVKTVASGGTLDLEDLSDLRDAGIDVSALVEGGIDNIAEISKLRDDYIQSVIDGLDEKIKIYNETLKQDKDITEEEKRQIEFEIKMIELRKGAIQSAAEGVKTTANEYITALKSANEIMAQAQAYGNGTISEDILSSMVEQYADMAGYVEKYRLGLIDNDELLNAFKEFYQNDISNYQDYQKEKYINTTEYFEKWKKVNSDWVEEFKEKYGIDLNNYSTYIEAKAAIENKYKKIKEIEAKGYDFSEYVDEEGNYTEAGKKFLAEGVTDSVTRDMAAVLKTYQSAKKGLNEEINVLTTEYAKTSEDAVIDTTFDMTEEIEARITTITDRMQGAYSLLHELQSSSSKLTIENLDAMKSAYPAMSQYIDQYLRKEMSRAELLSKFEEMYEQDKINYKNAQIEKLNYSEVAYSEFIKKNDDWVDEFKKDYQIDLENFTTFTAAKEAILNGMSKYIDINTGEFTDAGKYFINNVNSADDAIFAGAMYKVQHAFKKFAEKTSEFSEDVADDTADGITDAIEDAVYSIEDALSDVSTILSGQVDYWEQITNGIVAAAQLEIDALDKEIDLLEKKNEEQRRQIELQEKLEALNRAKTQRNVREYNAETGQFEWTTNKKNIETAQREYDEALQEDEIKSKEAAKEWYEKYGESFSNVSSTIETQRQINQALQLLASMRGVDVNTLSYKDLLNMTDEEQAAIRSKYGSAVDTNLAFEDAQNQQNINKAKTNLVTGGYATNGKTGFAFNWEAITDALGSSITTLAGTLDKYTEILKPTSFAETKPTANAVTNITNTGEVKNSYTFTGDMEFKFDKDVDADNFISKFVSKLQMQNGITTVK